MTREELLSEFAYYAYSFRPEDPFTLASGEKSVEYVDCREALTWPWILKAVAEQLYSEIRVDTGELEAVGGLTLGADPVALSLSLHSYEVARQAGCESTALRWFTVRKEPKQHGKGGRIVGNFDPGEPVLVVDDVVTTGKSTIEAIRVCREAGLEVRQVLCVLDRQAGGLAAIQDVLDDPRAGTTRAQALFTLEQVRESWWSRQPKTLRP